MQPPEFRKALGKRKEVSWGYGRAAYRVTLLTCRSTLSWIVTAQVEKEKKIYFPVVHRTRFKNLWNFVASRHCHNFSGSEFLPRNSTPHFLPNGLEGFVYPVPSYYCISSATTPG